MRLSEKIVQERALRYLRKKYRLKANRGRVFAKMEVKTRKKYGGKRADGLLAYRSWLGQMRVISLEAKSHKTLAAIRPKRKDQQLFLKSLWMGLAVCIGSGAFFFLYRMDDVYLQFAVPLNILVAAALLYGYLTRESSQYQFAKVLEQLQQYPANQQWLAFSADSLDSMPEQEKKYLRKICQRKGFGILIVFSKGKVKRWLSPTFQRKYFGDFLQYYSLEKEIRDTLS